MQIGLDIMGGDFAPEATLGGAVLALDIIGENNSIVLIGDEELITRGCKKLGADTGAFEIVHTTEYIGMGEHPAKAYAQKPNSSIGIGFKMLSRNELDGFASAGSTGAMMVGGIYTTKSIPGVIRPTITASVPTLSGKPIILLDVGINPDAKPDVLYQYAMLGSAYAEHVYGIQNPKVGLVNIGSEEEKGNLLTKASFQAMKDSQDFNFIGNVEANDFFNDDKVNVLVCDGFVGNVMLKEAEAFYALIRKRGIRDDFFEQFNFENYGGTPILGINGNAVIGHGISNQTAIKNMILHTQKVAEAKLTEKIKEAFNNG